MVSGIGGGSSPRAGRRFSFLGLKGGGHLEVTPARIVVEAQVDVVLQGDGETMHERGPRCDCVAVAHLRLLLLRDL